MSYHAKALEAPHTHSLCLDVLCFPFWEWWGEDGRLRCVVKGNTATALADWEGVSGDLLATHQVAGGQWPSPSRAAREHLLPWLNWYSTCVGPGALIPQKGCTCVLATCLAQLCASWRFVCCAQAAGHSGWLSPVQLEQSRPLPPDLPGLQQGEATCCTQTGAVLPGGAQQLLPGSFLSTQSSLSWAPALRSC